MALEEILAAIRADNVTEIRRLEAACADEIAAIVTRAEAEALRAEQEAMLPRRRAAEHEAARIVDRARLVADRAALEAVEAAFQEAIEAVIGQLAAMRSTAAYPGIVARLLDEGLDVLPDATRVRIDPADVELAGALLDARGRGDLVVETTSPHAGGIELATDDGRSLRNTFSSRLDRASGRLRCLVTAHLARVEPA